MGWPQYTYLVLNLIGLGFSLAEHGEPKTGYHNFWQRFRAFGVALFLLYSGGFFGGN